MFDKDRDDLGFTLGEVKGTVDTIVPLIKELSTRLREVERKLWYICGASIVVGVILSNINWLGVAVSVAEAATQ